PRRSDADLAFVTGLDDLTTLDRLGDLVGDRSRPELGNHTGHFLFLPLPQSAGRSADAVLLVPLLEQDVVARRVVLVGRQVDAVADLGPQVDQTLDPVEHLADRLGRVDRL